MGSLLGGKSKSKGSSTQTSTPGMTSAEVLANFNSNRTDTSQWSKEAAIADVQGTLKQQAYDALKEYMPSTAATQNTSGAYSTTTKQLLQNDAAAKTQQALAQTTLNAINAYGQLSNTADSNNAALLNAYGNVANDTRVSVGTSNNSSKGGTALMGLFAEGGEVPENKTTSDDFLQTFMDGTGLSKTLMDIKDMGSLMQKVSTGDFAGASKQVVDLSAKDDKEAIQQLNNIVSFVKSFSPKGKDTSSTPSKPGAVSTYADGGEVSTELPGLQGLTINIGTPDESKPIQQSAQASGGDSLDKAAEAAAIDIISSLFFADGGKVPEVAEKPDLLSVILKHAGNSEPAEADEPEAVDNPQEEAREGRTQAAPTPAMTPQEELLAAIKKYQAGGRVRSGEADVQNGGKIQGKQSPTGEDNQVIGVAGGEGIIPKDVMDVKGVPELVQKLIQTYHTPVNGSK